MFEDLRQEMEKVSNRPLAVLARLVLLAVMAIAIAVSVSGMLGAEPRIAPVLESSHP